MLYHSYVKSINFNSSIPISKEEEKKKILDDMDKEKELANIVPVIVFGLGFLFNSYIINKKSINLTVPFLLLSLLFGTIIPYIIMYNSFTDSNITKLLISETFLFSSESFSFTLLLSCVLIPYFHLEIGKLI